MKYVNPPTYYVGQILYMFVLPTIMPNKSLATLVEIASLEHSPNNSIAEVRSINVPEYSFYIDIKHLFIRVKE